MVRYILIHNSDDSIREYVKHINADPLPTLRVHTDDYRATPMEFTTDLLPITSLIDLTFLFLALALQLP